MGAETVELILPFEIEGCATLFSTNGKTKISNNGAYLFLWDAIVILKVNLELKKVEHFTFPRGKYIADFLENKDGYEIDLYGNFTRPKKTFFSKSEIKFKNGMGPVKNGLFPSAHKPHVREIKSNT